MLKSMRDGAKSIPMRIFLFALIIGFAMWGIDDVFRNTASNQDAVIAGDVRISAVEAAIEFERTRRTYRPQANNAEAVAEGMLGDVLAGLARRAIFDAEAERLNLAVTRDMEKYHIANEPAFQDDSGRFSLLRFQDTLSQVGLDEEDYLSYIHNDLKRSQILNAIAPGMNYSEALAERIAAWRLERRVISYIDIDIDPEASSAPTTAELEEFYELNGESYHSADLRELTVLVLSPDVLLEEATVSEDALRAAYEDQLDDFITPETRLLRQMVFATKDQADDAASRIKAGAEFTDIAEELLGLDEEDTSLGLLTEEDLTEDLSAPVFAASLQELIGPVETELGFHVMMVDDIRPSVTISFDDARYRLADSVELETATDLVYSRIGELEDSLASGATLEEAAQATGAEILTIEGMDRNGRDIDGIALDGIATDTKFRESVWTASIGDDGFVEETNADTFYVLRVNREIPSAPRPLEDVRERVVDDLKTQRAVQDALTKAESIVSGDTLENAGLKIITSPAMRRDGVSFDHRAARLIANKAFTLEQDEVSYVETGEQVVVIRVDSITPPESESLTAETARMQESLSQNLGASLDGILAQGLAQSIDVRINPQAVERLLIGAQN